jgi:hypothetical protein
MHHLTQIEAIRGVKPILLVFAPSAKSPAYEAQMPLIESSLDALNRLDVLVHVVLNESDSAGGPTGTEIRHRFGIRDDAFHVVVLDRHGREVRRYDAPVDPDAVVEVLSVSPGVE